MLPGTYSSYQIAISSDLISGDLKACPIWEVRHSLITEPAAILLSQFKYPKLTTVNCQFFCGIETYVVLHWK